MRVDELLNELESDQNREQSGGARLTALRNAWQLHVEQAEQTLLPEAESLLGPTKLQQLLYDMNAIRTRQSEMDSAIYPASRLGSKRLSTKKLSQLYVTIDWTLAARLY